MDRLGNERQDRVIEKLANFNMNLGDVEVKEEKLCKYKTKDRSKIFERERKTERETEEGCLHLHTGENWETQCAYPFTLPLYPFTMYTTPSPQPPRLDYTHRSP